jgi:hypothetical protein
MKSKHYVTLALSFALTIAPQLLPYAPPAYKDAASAAVALLASLYHLFQVPPTTAAHAPSNSNIFGS